MNEKDLIHENSCNLIGYLFGFGHCRFGCISVIGVMRYG